MARGRMTIDPRYLAKTVDEAVDAWCGGKHVRLVAALEHLGRMFPALEMSTFIKIAEDELQYKITENNEIEVFKRSVP